jgi:hypothetical protein
MQAPRVDAPLTDPAEARLPQVDVSGLLAREGLLSEPYEDTCCGEGRITHERTLWAELDGQAPPELVLETMEYVGEGAASWHYHVFDVRDPANPRRIGPALEDGGYIHYSYMRVVDLDRDGVDELMLVGEVRQTAPLRLFGLRGGALEVLNADEDLALVYLPFDHDGDGALELVGLKADHVDGDGPVSVAVFDGATAAPRAPARDPKAWLPDLLTDALTRPELPHAEPTLTLLTRLMAQEDLAPGDPRRVLDATLARLEAEPMGPNADAYVGAAAGEATEAQRARMKALMRGAGTARALPAARLWLRTARGPARAFALDWARARVADHALAGMPRDHLLAYAIVAELDAAERARICAHSRELMEAPGASPEALGNIAWDLWVMYGGCVDEVVWALEHEATLPAQAVRGAVSAFDKTQYTPARRAAYAPHTARIVGSLGRLLGHARADLRAEAARALGGLPGSVAMLRAALEAEADAEAQRSILVGLSDASDPGDPALFVRMLRDGAASARVERMLHAELARSGDPKALATGLTLATTPDAYDAYLWRVSYRIESLDEAQLDLLAADAFGRLDHPTPRMRQHACQLLARHPHLDGEVAELERVARDDGTSWVRDACAEAAQVMWSAIGPM